MTRFPLMCIAVSNWRPIITIPIQQSQGTPLVSRQGLCHTYPEVTYICNESQVFGRLKYWTTTATGTKAILREGRGPQFLAKRTFIQHIITYQKLMHSIVWVTVVTENRRTKEPRLWLLYYSYSPASCQHSLLEYLIAWDESLDLNSDIWLVEGPVNEAIQSCSSQIWEVMTFLLHLNY